MQLSEDYNQGQYTINRYETDKIIINHKTYTRSLILSKDQLMPDWPPQTIAELTSIHLQAIVKLSPEIVLLGTGGLQVFPHSKLFTAFYAQNIGIEIMSTAAACRTFNVLASEGRNVVAGIFIFWH